MNVAKKVGSAFVTDYPKVVAYMWQSSEYRAINFIQWWLRASNFRTLQKRGTLAPTTAGKLVRAIVAVTALAYLVVNVLSIWWLRSHVLAASIVFVVGLLAYPLIVALLTTIPVIILRLLWEAPKQARSVSAASRIFSEHPGIVVAVAGSYGKTTMKELLAQVIGTEKKVAFTEGNKNTLLSIAKFAATLQGNEDVVIVEFGEGASRDVEKMTAMVQPNYAVVTGLAPNHLDGYKDIDDIASDFASLLTYVGKEKSFINGDNALLVEKLTELATPYLVSGCLGSIVERIGVSVNKTTFTLRSGSEHVEITSGLVGRHNVSTLAFVAVFARELGVAQQAIRTALSNSKPYEHRLEPREFHGAWLIDDTYNGSIEGMKAGLSLLAELKTKSKKIYVTPGLVDQGLETERVHTELGKAIASTQPDELYLMDNSVENYIESSVLANGYTGKLKVIEDPLKFYQHLEAIVAKDDIIMCQNDWPDYYQ